MNTAATQRTRTSAFRRRPALVLVLAMFALPLLGNNSGEVELTLVTTLEKPVFVTHAGDERIFIVERDGRILILENGVVLPVPFLDIRSQVGMKQEGGLLSVAFHPKYASNGQFFISYTDADSPVHSILARYEVSQTDHNLAEPTSAKILLKFRRPSYSHNGGQLQFGPRDSYLYASFGDGGGPADPRCLAQRDPQPFGKILRFDVDKNSNTKPYFGVPRDNPFRARDKKYPGVTNLVWAKGLRNPWRFSFDRETGDLYIGDSGHHSREEIDFQPAASHGGENYGWKRMEGNACLADLGDARARDPSGKACPADTPPCFDPRYTPAIHDYPHEDANCAVVGGYVYRGRAIPDLQGHYLFGDFCSARIWSLKRNAAGTFDRTDIIDAGAGLTSFGEDLDGEVYVTVRGKVLKITPSRKKP